MYLSSEESDKNRVTRSGARFGGSCIIASVTIDLVVAQNRAARSDTQFGSSCIIANVVIDLVVAADCPGTWTNVHQAAYNEV